MGVNPLMNNMPMKMGVVLWCEKFIEDMNMFEED
jgi:hypothetical protein